MGFPIYQGGYTMNKIIVKRTSMEQILGSKVEELYCNRCVEYTSKEMDFLAKGLKITVWYELWAPCDNDEFLILNSTKVYNYFEGRGAKSNSPEIKEFLQNQLEELQKEYPLQRESLMDKKLFVSEGVGKPIFIGVNEEDNTSIYLSFMDKKYENVIENENWPNPNISDDQNLFISYIFTYGGDIEKLFFYKGKRYKHVNNSYRYQISLLKNQYHTSDIICIYINDECYLSGASLLENPQGVEVFEYQEGSSLSHQNTGDDIVVYDNSFYVNTNDLRSPIDLLVRTVGETAKYYRKVSFRGNLYRGALTPFCSTNIPSHYPVVYGTDYFTIIANEEKLVVAEANYSILSNYFDNSFCDYDFVISNGKIYIVLGKTSEFSIYVLGEACIRFESNYNERDLVFSTFNDYCSWVQNKPNTRYYERIKAKDYYFRDNCNYFNSLDFNFCLGDRVKLIAEPAPTTSIKDLVGKIVEISNNKQSITIEYFGRFMEKVDVSNVVKVQTL